MYLNQTSSPLHCTLGWFQTVKTHVIFLWWLSLAPKVSFLPRRHAKSTGEITSPWKQSSTNAYQELVYIYIPAPLSLGRITEARVLTIPRVVPRGLSSTRPAVGCLIIHLLLKAFSSLSHFLSLYLWIFYTPPKSIPFLSVCFDSEFAFNSWLWVCFWGL